MRQFIRGWRPMPKTIFGGSHQHLVDVLTQSRKAAGITQTELAMKIGRDQTFVSLIERGQRRVDVVEFITLVKAIGHDPVALLREIVDRIDQG